MGPGKSYFGIPPQRRGGREAAEFSRDVTQRTLGGISSDFAAHPKNGAPARFYWPDEQNRRFSHPASWAAFLFGPGLFSLVLCFLFYYFSWQMPSLGGRSSVTTLMRGAVASDTATGQPLRPLEHPLDSCYINCSSCAFRRVPLQRDAPCAHWMPQGVVSGCGGLRGSEPGGYVFLFV